MDVIPWKFQVNPFRKLKEKEVWRPEIFKDDSWLDGIADVIVWFGDWSKGGLSDTNTRLWIGFEIEFPRMRILFGEDGGYDAHYTQLASLFGHFNYAILGIGAYEPS